MAKEDKATTPEEQLAAAVEAKRQATAKKLADLEDAASFKTLVESGKKPLGDIRDAWSMFLDAVKACDDLVKEQAVAVKAAREFAAANGLTTNITELGHEPLVAHSMYNVSKLPWPAVMRPAFYVSQFPSEADLWMNIQLTLNYGQPVLVAGGQMSNEEVGKALLSGVRPADLQSKGAVAQQAPEAQRNAANWFGFKPKAA